MSRSAMRPSAMGTWPATAQRLWQRLHGAGLQRLLALKPRERKAVTGMLVAALAGLELLWIEPMHLKRRALQEAAHQQETSTQEAEQNQRAQQERETRSLQERLATVDQALKGHGGASAPQAQRSLGVWLDQALAGQAVRLVALRDLEPEPVALEAIENTGSETAAQTAPGQAAGAVHTLHRLRFEMQLGGEPAALAQATQNLAERLAPLRLTRVQLARNEAGTVQATLLFVILASDPAWIRL